MAVRRRCFRCGYSLKGLPEVHRCPECGLPYYAWTALFEESSSDVYLGAGFAVVGLGVLVAEFTSGRASTGVISFAAVSAGLLYGAWRWRRGRRNRAGICEEGIFLYHWKEADSELIPWDRVGGAVIGHSYAVVLNNADGRVQRELPLEFFGSRKRADQFVLAIHDRLRRRGP